VIRTMRARQRLFGAVMTQFVRPHGFAGRLTGWEMALRPSNRKRNRWAVALLDVQPQDHILEIGFGPGLAIRELARRATDGFVLGIDHSEVMVRQAAVRNRAAVEQGRVELRLGSALDLRDFSEMFDKALAVNNFGMWPEPEARLKDLRGALRRVVEWRLSRSRAVSVPPPRQPNASVRRLPSDFATLASSASKGRR
jgi:SAM-dependent methyltransferase